ncbi:hypothetical protein Tco_0968063, partial [Tanacetum coccineum]
MFQVAVAVIRSSGGDGSDRDDDDGDVSDDGRGRLQLKKNEKYLINWDISLERLWFNCDDGCHAFELFLLNISSYGSSLLILSAYASSMPPVLSLPLYMACDDSDGCMFLRHFPTRKQCGKKIGSRNVTRFELVTPEKNKRKGQRAEPQKYHVLTYSSRDLNTAEDLRLPEEDNDCMKIKTCEEIFMDLFKKKQTRRTLYSHKEMDLETAQTNATTKLPILKQGEYKMWRLRIEQYFQVQDYALWDVIENGNSFKPTARTTAKADGTSTSMIPGPVTTEEKAQKKNDVKER